MTLLIFSVVCLFSNLPVSALIFIVSFLPLSQVQFAVTFPDSWYEILGTWFSTFLIYRHLELQISPKHCFSHIPQLWSVFGNQLNLLLPLFNALLAHIHSPDSALQMQSSILASSRVSKAGSLKELEEGPCGLESKSETGGEGEGRARSIMEVYVKKEPLHQPEFLSDVKRRASG